MRILLGCLMCLVLGASQCFAISGGPFGGGSANVVGTYAGVLKPKITIPDTPPGCSANSLGVFSIGVPSSGISSGTFVMFSQGRIFTGTVQGTADPDKATLKAILNASVNFSVTVPSPSPSTTFQVTATATGAMNAKITNSSSFAFASSSTRLAGKATLDVSQGEVDPVTLQPISTCQMTLAVRGFRQSTTAPTATSSP